MKAAQPDSRTRVHRETDKVWIDIPGFSTDEYASSVHGCQARILQTVGESADYADLICCNGFAFRVQVAPDFCPSAGHPFMGYECTRHDLAKDLWRIDDLSPTKGSDEQPPKYDDNAIGAVKASIERGVPVQYEGEEDGLIVGYAVDGARWLCIHPYHQAGQQAFWYDEGDAMAGGNGNPPWRLAVWIAPRPDAERTPDAELLKHALALAVEMWESSGPYPCGQNGYRHWIESLRHIDDGRFDDPQLIMQGNAWCMDVLVHARRIASDWLRGKADTLPDKPSQRLEAAADAYSDLVAACLKDVESTWEITLWPGAYPQWTNEVRDRQIQRLEVAREYDLVAIGAIREALSLMTE
jgi:hypothetical protein